MKILITGGAGFIGSNLSKFLLNKGHKITIVDDFSSGKHLNIEGLDLTVLENRVEDLEVNRFEKIDCILHLAAQASVPLSIDNFYQSSANNFLSSLKVGILYFCAKSEANFLNNNGISSFLFLSGGIKISTVLNL